MATISKRGNSYRIRVSDGYDVNGKQRMRSMTWTPDPGMTPRQIEKELNRQAVLFEESRNMTANVKFQTFSEQWFKEYAEHKLRAKTIERYHQYEKRVYKAIGHLRIDRITPRQLQSFINNLGEDGINETTGGTLAPKTIKQYLSFISSIMDYAVKMEVIAENPCRHVSLPSAKAKERDIYSLDEAQHFLELLQDEPLQYQVFFILAIYGGFRRGELLGLEWKDIDFENYVISIRRSSLYVKGRGIITDDTKTDGSHRSLKLPAEVFDYLRRYRVQQSAERLKIGDQWIDNDRLFTAWNGAPMNPNTPYSWYDRFCKRTGIRRVSIHSFRHLNASLLIDSGADVKTVSASLGHSQATTTLNIYAHTFAEAQAKAAQAVADKISLRIKNEA